MRLFEYNCESHGSFELMRPLGLRKHPAPCPECGKLAPRSFDTMPNLRQIDPSRKKAIDRNIKSQFEPHICGANCGHEAPNLIPPSQKQKPKVESYNGPRSWVIEHAI
ncbi:MAG: zinc ribbon domain-containing protein [Opitutae bacterium]|nr:zinc ribbon domain-containing protein [Opitutae bacterium]MDG1302397.1 zinc ribbon domain-containing protein [Opitutae bacterium]